MTERLKISGLKKSFGGLTGASDINLSLHDGDRTALIGPNGAGKTTLVNLITGALPPSDGELYLDGHRINALDQAARARAGIVRTFQVSRLCRDLSVIDNVALPIIQRRGWGLKMWPSRTSRRLIDDEAMSLLAALHLDGSAARMISELAYGEQRLVEIAIALAQRPRVLLLDEPAAGVPESEAAAILASLAQLPAELPILLIEHDMDLVFKFATRVVVLVAGCVIFEGTPAQVAENEKVRNIYFGRAGHGATGL